MDHKIDNILQYEYKLKANQSNKINKNQSEKLAQIEETAQKFESYIISTFHKISSERIKVNKFYGGGKAEEIYRSILVDEQVDKFVTDDKTLGIKKLVIEELLRKEGLSK